MARPTARVLALLELLQRGGAHTAASLAAELDVDERTVRRYIEQLLELDIPVVGVRGRYGGYRLASGYRMPPLMLGEDEALAVMLGLVAGERSGLTASVAAASESAAAKLRTVLPEPVRRRVDALLDTTEFTAPPTVAPTAETRVLLLFAQAARDRRPVWFSYTSRDGRASTRTLQPYGIVAHSARWYVTGRDSASGQVRTFRLDRIATPSLLPGTFDVPAGFDASAAVLGSLAATPWRHEVSVRAQESAEALRRRFAPGIATTEDLGDGWARLRLRAERLDWVAAVLAGVGGALVVEQPEELRDELRALASRLAAAASVPA